METAVVKQIKYQIETANVWKKLSRISCGILSD